MRGRQLALALTLAATLVATWWASRLDEGDAVPAAPALGSRESRPSSAAGAGGPDRSGARDEFALLREPWPAYSDEMMRVIRAAPPPPLASQARPAPSAPALPFRYAGRIEDERGEAVFLLDGNRVRMARPGEKLDGRYRLERISASGVEFTFLPLNTKQTLSRQNP